MAATEFRFEPESIVLRRGEKVRIALRNDGELLHNWKVGGLDAKVIDSHSTGPLSGDEGEVFAGADAGEQGWVTFVPEEAGEFEVYCTVPQHRDRGMEGLLLVEGPPS